MPRRTHIFVVGDRQLAVEVLDDGRIHLPEHGLTVSVDSIDGHTYRIDANGTRRLVVVAETGDRYWVSTEGEVFVIRKAGRPASQSDHRAQDHGLSAPMPATVIGILAQPGQALRRGDVVVILEAMKMELPLRAPRDGIVERIHCRPGDLVDAGQPLVEFT